MKRGQEPGEIEGLRSLRRDVDPPPDLERQTLAAVRASRPRRRTTFLAAAAVATAFLAGLVIGRWTAAAPEVAPGYALFLEEGEAYRQPGPEGVAVRVAEYRAWAEALDREGRLVLAGQLHDEGLRIPRDTTDGDVRITGLFVVDAESTEAAATMARESPHVRYGGTVLVRPVVR